MITTCSTLNKGVKAVMKEETRLKVLDGLRGISILLVMIFHFTVPYRAELLKSNNLLVEIYYAFANSGWIGVDLFFALSGFLITRILLDKRETERYILSFFARRFLRIFPLYYFVLCLVFLVLPHTFFVYGQEFSKLMHNQLWLWFHGANILPSFGDRSAFNSEWVTVVHFWSLAVEEHFYLIWPFLVYFLNLNELKRVCVLIIVIAFLSRIGFLAFGLSNNAVYSFTLCRFDVIATGALAAIYARQVDAVKYIKLARRIFVFSTFTVLLVLMSDNGWHKNSPFIQIIIYSVTGMIGASFCYLGLMNEIKGFFLKLMRGRLLQIFGRYSYGIYVWHLIFYGYIVKVLLPISLLTPFIGSEVLAIFTQISLLIGISLLIAMISWHMIEKYFLGLKRYFDIPLIVEADYKKAVRTDVR